MKLPQQSASYIKSGSATSSSQRLPERQILQSEQEVHNYLHDPNMVSDLRLGAGRTSNFTNICSTTRLDGMSA